MPSGRRGDALIAATSSRTLCSRSGNGRKSTLEASTPRSSDSLLRRSSLVNVSMPQSVWCITPNSFVPRSSVEMTRERIASSDARPPALRIMCASPMSRPSACSGWIRASIHVSTARCCAGGIALSPWRNFLANSLLRSMKRWITPMTEPPGPGCKILPIQSGFGPGPAGSSSAHGVLDGVGVELAAAAGAAEEVRTAFVLAPQADAGHIDDHPAHGIARLVEHRRRLRGRAELARRLQRDELGEHRHADLVPVELAEVEAGRRGHPGDRLVAQATFAQVVAYGIGALARRDQPHVPGGTGERHLERRLVIVALRRHHHRGGAVDAEAREVQLRDHRDLVGMFVRPLLVDDRRSPPEGVR